MPVTELIHVGPDSSALRVLPDGSLAIGTTSGLVSRTDPAAERSRSIGVGGAVRGLAVHLDGGVIAALPTRGLVGVRFTPAGPRRRLLLRMRRAQGLAVNAARQAFVASSTSPGWLLRFNLDTLSTARVASGFSQPSSVALPADGRKVIVLERSARRRLIEVDLVTRMRTPLSSHLGDAVDIAWAGPGDNRLVVGDAAGRVLLVDTSVPGSSPVVLADGLNPVWGVDAFDSDRIVVGSGDHVLIVDLPVEPMVRIDMPAKALYLSSWYRVPVRVSRTAKFDDLLFRIDPPEGGLVSYSRDVTFDPSKPDIVLVTSGRPGAYKLIAQDRTTGAELGEATFDIGDVWEGPDGPPLAFVGEASNYGPDATWGGGDPYVPQNIDFKHTPPTRNVAIVVVETNDAAALSAADAATLRTTLQDEVFGVMVESTRNYFRDTSSNQHDIINAGVIGPLRLDNDWDTYVPEAKIKTTGSTEGVAEYSAAVVAELRLQNEALAAAGQPPLLDLQTVDSIMIVMRSLPANPAAMFAGRFHWPYATRPGGYRLKFEIGRQVISVPFPFGSIDISLPIERFIEIVFMPDDWNARVAPEGRTFAGTAAHELSHNLGLPDQYALTTHSTDAQNRDVGAQSRDSSWSLMSWEENFAQLSAPEKMVLGWIQAPWVRNLSFAMLGPVDETVVLHAADELPPPANRHSVVEVRLADGQNYYFEYRRELATEASDRDLPADRTVLGTHFISGDIEPPDRRMLLKIRNDADIDNGEFQHGDDYEETDTTSPKYPNDFKMEVLETQADFARVHILYGDAKPDPQIRPWSATTNWKSPDLLVENARNLADASFRDIPWEGHPNTLVATVRNPGKVDAHGVRVDFFFKDFTLSDGTEYALGSDTHDVAADTEVQFRSSVAWVPFPFSIIPLFGSQIQAHYCVVARIAEYADPANPAIMEVTPDNNEAQSNHTQLISFSSSPSSREIGLLKVRNPYPVAAAMFIDVRQTSPYVRTYLEHSWVDLGPGQERDVLFLTESMIGDPMLDSHLQDYRFEIYRRPNSLRLTGIADTRAGCHGSVIGGAHVVVRAARRTEFVAFGQDSDIVFGEVRTTDTHEGVNGKALVTLSPPGVPEREESRVGQVIDGFFRLEVGHVAGGWSIQGHYLGDIDKAPCSSKEILSQG
jgi:hypothetical protein